ncbi:MAG: RNA polymerase factor sigma-32 [Pseudobdellovibrio sp.]
MAKKKTATIKKTKKVDSTQKTKAAQTKSKDVSPKVKSSTVKEKKKSTSSVQVKTKKSSVKTQVSQSTEDAEVKKVRAEIVDDSHDFQEGDTQDNLNEPIHYSDETYVNNDDPTVLDSEDTNSLVPALAPDKTVRSSDPLTTYLSEIRKYPVLTKEEELKLAKRYQETKDPEAAQALVRANLRFVVKIAAEYARFSSKMIDLIQEGNVGLMHAVKEFNPDKGARLITYAVWWIRGYIQEYLMRQFSMVRIGTTANQRKLFYQLQKQKQELEKMSTSENIHHLSEKLGIPEDEVAEMAKRLSDRDVSLDKSNDDESPGLSLSNILKKDDGSLPLDEQLALAEQLKYLKDAIEKVQSQLTEKEKIILEERVLSDEPLTLQEIGEKYKITREAVRQNEARLINKIKTTLQDLMKIHPE